jgi:hypothetical protein
MKDGSDVLSTHHKAHQLRSGAVRVRGQACVRALLDGLLQGWLLDPSAFDLKRVGARAVDTHLAGLTVTA